MRRSERERKGASARARERERARESEGVREREREREAVPPLDRRRPDASLQEGERKEQLLCRNLTRFRGGLVFKAHRLVYHSNLGSKEVKKKEQRKGNRDLFRLIPPQPLRDTRQTRNSVSNPLSKPYTLNL